MSSASPQQPPVPHRETIFRQNRTCGHPRRPKTGDPVEEAKREEHREYCRKAYHLTKDTPKFKLKQLRRSIQKLEQRLSDAYAKYDLLEKSIDGSP